MKTYLLPILVAFFLSASYTGAYSQSLSWKEEVKRSLPLLGHRNWIVITDMAYPLQTKPGIKTIYTGEDYMNILTFVSEEINKASHIKPIIYQDQELGFLTNSDAKGIEDLKKKMKKLLGDQVEAIPHEELIGRLDEVSQMFEVIILKSTLTIPYTSTFIEFDCNYWDATRQNKLDAKMKSGK